MLIIYQVIVKKVKTAYFKPEYLWGLCGVICNCFAYLDEINYVLSLFL